MNKRPMLLGAGWLIGSALFLFALFKHGVSAEWIRAAGFFLAGVGVAPLGLLLAQQRTASLSGQTENESARRITDAFTKAVELLGHENDAVRQGGIYALGRLASENRHEHPKIIDIVAAYVRYKSQKGGAQSQKEGRDGDPLIDVGAAIAVIRDRNTQFDATPGEKRYRFDLSGCHLAYADLTGVNFARVNLSDCVFESCLFEGADLSGANMAGSKFPESEFNHANLSRANLHGADLRGINISQPQVNSANGDGDTMLPDGIERPPEWSRD